MVVVVVVSVEAAVEAAVAVAATAQTVGQFLWGLSNRLRAQTAVARGPDLAPFRTVRVCPTR